MHISKTAGTAFREAILENYKQSEVAYLYPDPPGFLCGNLALLPLQQRRNFRLVIGHFQFGIHQVLPQQSTYVTIVRDPFARVLSEFRYSLEIRSDGPERPEDSAAYLVELLERRESVALDNQVVRCFSGVSERDFPPGHISKHVYDLAVHNLKTAFLFVGHQEKSDEAYRELRRKFNWKPSSLAIVNRHAVAGGNYESARAAIEHFNQWDCRLYSEIRQSFP